MFTPTRPIVAAATLLLSALVSAQPADRRRVTLVEFEGAKELGIKRIEERWRQHDIAFRLGAPPPDGRALCVAKEVLRDMLAEKEFTEAEVTHTLEPARGDDSSLKLVFRIEQGVKSKRPDGAGVRLTPAERCSR